MTKKIEKTEKELHEVVKALINWFESQNVDPADASIVCALCIGLIIRTKRKPGRSLETTKKSIMTIMESQLAEDH